MILLLILMIDFKIVDNFFININRIIVNNMIFVF